MIESRGSAAEGASSSSAPDKKLEGGTAERKEKSEAQEAADKLYEERIEEEYAKREGGA